MSLFKTADIEVKSIADVKSSKASAKSEKNRALMGKRYARCQEVIGEMQPGDCIHYASMGEWSMHDLLKHLLQQTGPAKVYVATWSASPDGCKQIINLLEEGAITSVHAVFDWRIRVRTPEALSLAKMNFSDVRVNTCHAKVTVIENDDWHIAIVGSANYTNNPRIECGVIHDSKTAADFHRKWINDIIQKSDPFDEKANSLF